MDRADALSANTDAPAGRTGERLNKLIYLESQKVVPTIAKGKKHSLLAVYSK